MKPLLVLLVVCGILLGGCSGILPTLEPTPTPPNTVTPDAKYPVLVTSEGLVYVRTFGDVPTGDFLLPGEPVFVYGRSETWCYVDLALTKKVWCGCVGIGPDGCKER